MARTHTRDEDESEQKTGDRGKGRGRARAVTGGMTGAKWGGRIGGDKGKLVGAVGGAFAGRHRGRKQGQENEAENEAKGKKTEESSTKILATEAGKAYVDTQAKRLAWESAAASWGTSLIAYYGFKYRHQLKYVLLAVLILLFWLLDGVVFDPTLPSQLASSEVCTPQEVSYGETSVCVISVQYNGSADDITVASTILPGTDFVSAGQGGTYDKTTNTVTWDAQKLGLQLSPVNFAVSVTVRVTTKQNNVKVWNAYLITPTGLSNADNSGASGAIPGNIPPSTDNCSGIYTYYMSITPGHQNYGDPNCSLVKKDPNGVAIINKDLILQELQKIKPSEAMGWFICVVPHESGYNANAYLGASTSGNGAYGLVQMNPTGKGNGQYDNGEVNWPLQLSNGINYNDKVIGHSFSYWPTSYDPCLRGNGISVP